MKRTLLLSSLLVAVLVVAYAAHIPAFNPGDNSTVIKFSHKFHADAGVEECVTCHTDAASSTDSKDNILAKKAACASCHDVNDDKDCSKCHYEDRYEPLKNPNREVLFSHARHVGSDGMKCETCHTGINGTDYATKANMPEMTACMTCHDNRTATAVCESCHTDFITLLPDDHRASDFRKEHKQLTRLGGVEVSCQTCHTEESCQQCHTGTGLKAFGKGDLVTDPRPMRAARDGAAKTALQKAHDLNYRFTHGIDARARQSECTTCHEPAEFCAPCHNTGGNITAGKFKPASHFVAGFTKLGRGSGGGEHARLAERDMEQCVACHDVEGRDPVCTICHLDNGRVR